MTNTLQEIHTAIQSPPKDFVDSQKPADLPSTVTCSFTEGSDFTMAPGVAERMVPLGAIMAAPTCPFMTMEGIREVGFYNWWAPMDSMFGSLCIGG